MKLHPGEFDGHIEHMMAPGENYVPMHAYRFNRDAIDNLIHDLWSFWHGGGSSSSGPEPAGEGGLFQYG